MVLPRCCVDRQGFTGTCFHVKGCGGVWKGNTCVGDSWWALCHAIPEFPKGTIGKVAASSDSMWHPNRAWRKMPSSAYTQRLPIVSVRSYSRIANNSLRSRQHISLPEHSEYPFISRTPKFLMSHRPSYISWCRRVCIETKLCAKMLVVRDILGCKRLQGIPCTENVGIKSVGNRRRVLALEESWTDL